MLDVDLIRHAYVRPDRQRHGVGAALIEHLRLVSPEQTTVLLETYWAIPRRQAETSVVLAYSPPASVAEQ
ncbi:MAG TPA: GNAT family N-acetyltransferase [Gemmatimonadaceae bacterium]